MEQQLGFEDFILEVEESNKEFKQSQKVRYPAAASWQEVVGALTLRRRGRGLSQRRTA
jgi:hypothetical protein